MAEPVERYLVELVLATRTPRRSGPLLELGAVLAAPLLDLCARANAWLDGRSFVTPEDVQSIAHDVFRHRLICSFEADAQGLDSDYLIEHLLQQVPYRSVGRARMSQGLCLYRSAAAPALSPQTQDPREQGRHRAQAGLRLSNRKAAVDFAEVRQYQPGDDIRSIDWRVTAQKYAAYQVFREERERPALLLWIKASICSGSQQRLKSVARGVSGASPGRLPPAETG